MSLIVRAQHSLKELLMRAPSILPLILLASCNAEPEPLAPIVKPPVAIEDRPDMPLDHPDLGSLAVLSRGPRRLSVDQLERSIEQIGGLDRGSVVIPENLALTLGRPDYVKITDESLDPTPLFMKFMMDLGGIICGILRDADPLRPVDQRIFLRYPTTSENLRHLVVRFTGIEGAMADPYVYRLNKVFEAGIVGANELAGYEATCIALFTAPEFLLY